MTDTKLTVIGLDKIRARFKNAPNVYKRQEKQAMNDTLHALWENVPEYPFKTEGDYLSPTPKSPKKRRYGLLGKSLGVDMSGNKLSKGNIDIWENKPIGAGAGGRRGKFGTREQYAPFVIGTGTQRRHPSWSMWWTMKDVVVAARPKILKLWREFVEDLAKYLEGQGFGL